MRVSDIMTSPAIAIPATATLSDVIPLMLRHGLSGVPVLDETNQIVGILSEGDLLRRIELGTATMRDSWWSRIFTAISPAEAYRRANGRKVSDVMSPHAVTVDKDDTLADAARLMQTFKIKRLPVTSEGALVGMLTRADFMKALGRSIAPAYEEQATCDEEIKARIVAEIAREPWSANCALRVEVSDAVVTLCGSTPTADQRAATVVAAENVVGVRSVTDAIDVVEVAPLVGM